MCSALLQGGNAIRILVTNDDGVESPGIHALAEKLAELGEVTVVAPAHEVSGVSHALTLSEPLRYEQLEERIFSVNRDEEFHGRDVYVEIFRGIADICGKDEVLDLH